MKILTFSTLFPNSVMPSHGIFVQTRLQHLIKSHPVEPHVLAPVPWFPFKGKHFGQYGVYATVPHSENRLEIDVQHPRYPLLPKIGMTTAPLLLAIRSWFAAKSIQKTGFCFDLIDAHYFYPDGVAAVLLGGWLGKPVVITARGTDLNLIPKYAIPRWLIKWAASRADGIITVCQALKDVLVDLGIADKKVNVLRNGVNLELFVPPQDRQALRQSLGIERKTILSVGHLIERKGHDLVIQALKEFSDLDLIIAGDGPESDKLNKLVSSLGLSDRVKFLGAVGQQQLKQYYGAADALILASSREGWANVLLEAMACGTPVVATRVWGTPEVVTSRESGVLVPERSAHAIATGIRQLLGNYPNRTLTRAYAEKFNWDKTSAGQYELFTKILAQKN